MKDLKNITLEISLKPFKSTESSYIKKVCETAVSQWLPLIRHAEMVSVMFWAADGSEILDYKGRPEDEFEWAKYIGGAVRLLDWDRETDPEGIGLHTTNYLYMDEPPVMTYAILKEIVSTFKAVAAEMTGKPVRAGATFDPGPEFAKSEFKYERHPEICVGESMGRKSMVCSYALLNADDKHYAGFPDGIPQDTPMGTFLGRQAQIFMDDLGFDYLWLSNGFGFGTETWGIKGAIFDGEAFYPEKIPETQDRILDFWKLFRKECSYRVETRGTNLSLGIDMATDAVDIKGIYEGGFDILPPPNSPWAAIDGDFGLELSGYMSRIAKLPDDGDFLFRFYVHDPWWMNSPWIDRYEGRPHDIYLPLSIARIDKDGKIGLPTNLNFLTIDDSLGRMPERCPNEVIPHILRGFEEAPDKVSPVVWAYPFDEYNTLGAGDPAKIFFEDWFMRGAINSGFPVSTVVAADYFAELTGKGSDIFCGSVVVTPVPFAGSVMNEAVRSFVLSGGNAILYGSLANADPELLRLIGLKRGIALTGQVRVVQSDSIIDTLKNGEFDYEAVYSDLLTNGGVCEIPDDGSSDGVNLRLLAWTDGPERRALFTETEVTGGKVGKVFWVRGSDQSRMPDGGKGFPFAALMRTALARTGLRIAFKKENSNTPDPVIMLHRNKNALIFSGYSPDTTTAVKLATPFGMPLLMGYETRPDMGMSVYTPERAWRAECRVMVEQEDDTVISCREIAPVSYRMHRRIEVKGLKNAVVRILPNSGSDVISTDLKLNSEHPHAVGEEIRYSTKETQWGMMIETEPVTGTLVISDRVFC